MEKASEKPALKKPVFVNMKNMEPGTRVNMHVRVAEAASNVQSKKRFDGTENRSGEVLVGDQHGCAVFIARNEQLDLCRVGDVITIRNAHAKVNRGFMKIVVDKWGKVEKSKDKVGEVKTSNNLSKVEYELVTVKN